MRLNRGQALALAALESLPDEMKSASSRSSVLVGVARHLRDDLGVACEVSQAAVGNRNRNCGTEYLMVDHLRISRWGEVGNRAILAGAWRRWDMGKLPRLYRFDEVAIDDNPSFFHDEEHEQAGAVQSWLRKQALEEQLKAANGAIQLPIAQWAIRVLGERLDSTSSEADRFGVLEGMAQHLTLDRGVNAWASVVVGTDGSGNTTAVPVLSIEGRAMDWRGETDMTQAAEHRLLQEQSQGRLNQPVKPPYRVLDTPKERRLLGVGGQQVAKAFDGQAQMIAKQTRQRLALSQDEDRRLAPTAKPSQRKM